MYQKVSLCQFIQNYPVFHMYMYLYQNITEMKTVTAI